MKAGLVSSMVSGLFILLATVLAFGPTDFNIIVIYGSIFGLAAHALGAWILYFGIGIFIWGITYGITERNIGGTTFSKGVLFGILIWLIVMIIIMPLSNSGLFATKYGLAGVLFTLILDLIFGVTLSVTYNRFSKRRM